MRLSQEIKNKLVKSSKYYFGSHSKIYLFGSRVDDSQKGGDIDLLIESEEKIDYDKQVKFLSDVYKNITERKVDLLIKTPFSENKPIYETIEAEKVLLC